MSYIKYPQYKQSGQDWLREVPEHWEVLSIKRLTPVSRGASPRPIEDPKYFDDEGEYAWVRIADVTSNYHYLRETTQRLSDLGKSLSVPLEPGALFLSIAGSVGKPMITAIKACIHDGFVYFPQLQINFEFLYYIFESGQPYLGLGKFGTQLNLNTDTVGGIKIGLPPRGEQDAIVTFLDWKTGQIDALIARKQELLAKLKEKRLAVITQAVTKGLNPAAPLRDSGIPWLGQVPEHWEVGGFTKFVAHRADYRGKTPEKVREGVFLITARNIKGGRIDYDLSQEYVREDEYADIMSRGLPKIGDLLFTTEAPLGEVANIDREDIALAQRVIKFQGEELKLNNYFAKYWMMSAPFQGHLTSLATGSTALGIKASKLFALRSVVPSLEEQQQIVDYLNAKIEEFGEMERKVQEVIDRLAEYRTALITAATTGKIDVRGVQIPQTTV